MSVDRKSSRAPPTFQSFISNQFAFLKDNCEGGADISDQNKAIQKEGESLNGTQIQGDPLNGTQSQQGAATSTSTGTIPKKKNTDTSKPDSSKTSKDGAKNLTFQERMDALLAAAKKNNAGTLERLEKTWGPPPLTYRDASKTNNSTPSKPLTPDEEKFIKEANSKGIVPIIRQQRNINDGTDEKTSQSKQNLKKTRQNSYRSNPQQRNQWQTPLSYRPPPPPTQLPAMRQPTIPPPPASTPSYAAVTQSNNRKTPTESYLNYRGIADKDWPHIRRQSVLFPLPKHWT